MQIYISKVLFKKRNNIELIFLYESSKLNKQYWPIDNSLLRS